MRAGLLADIILGESPHLKGLVRYFNLLVLDINGRITGFNSHFIRNSRKDETYLLNQNFVRLFDSDEGKADLQHSVKQALKGQPGAVSFYLFEEKVRFKGVILPVYDRGHEPTSLIIISKEEHEIRVHDDELENFWELASQMIREAGIEPSVPPIAKTEKRYPKILLVNDHEGLINSIFRKKLGSQKDDFQLAESTETALEKAADWQPNVVITAYPAKGNLPVQEMARQLKLNQITVIFLSKEEIGLRIEDGWLDIHVKNHQESVNKIIELISQLYW